MSVVAAVERFHMVMNIPLTLLMCHYLLIAPLGAPPWVSGGGADHGPQRKYHNCTVGYNESLNDMTHSN